MYENAQTHTDIQTDLTSRLRAELCDILPKAESRGWFDDLNAIRAVEQDRFQTMYTSQGMYRSYEREVWLWESLKMDFVEVFLHEMGHHLHYIKAFDDPREYDTREAYKEYFYSSADENPLFNAIEAENVAESFANFHMNGEPPWNETKYDVLDGPELEDPLLTR